MVSLFEESSGRFQRIMRNNYNVEYSKEDALEARNNLIGYLELLIKIDEENKKHSNSI